MTRTIDLEEYRLAIGLDTPFIPDAAELNPELKNRIVDDLIQYLSSERGEKYTAGQEASYAEKRRKLKAMLTVRPAEPFPDKIISRLDELFAAEALYRETNDPVSASGKTEPGQTLLWQGDIASLKVDAIVNAANGGLQGCFQPFHNCIDNIIHSAAGPRLRQDCADIIALQGNLEPVGNAKITRGYHLPANFVLHTVGPSPGSAEVTAQHSRDLSECYRSCLNLAARIEEIRTIAFCCISTGVFGFPKEKAAKLAVFNVHSWLSAHPNRFDAVIFNVFEDLDYNIYKKVLADHDALQ